VICDRVERLLDHMAAVDVVFCSELLEHLPNRQLPAVLEVLEAVARRELIITVPNRLSPHAHMDPTHVLRYRFGSLLRQLNQSRRSPTRCTPWGSPTPTAGGRGAGGRGASGRGAGRWTRSPGRSRCCPRPCCTSAGAASRERVAGAAGAGLARRAGAAALPRPPYRLGTVRV
jgi:hypothetical protein